MSGISHLRLLRILVDGNQSVYFIHRAFSGISPPVLQTSPVQGAQHIRYTEDVSVSVLDISGDPLLHHF